MNYEKYEADQYLLRPPQPCLPGSMLPSGPQLTSNQNMQRLGLPIPGAGSASDTRMVSPVPGTDLPGVGCVPLN